MDTQLRAFLVDANVEAHDRALRVLDQMNCHTTAFTEGRMALQRLKAQPGSYDVLITSTDLGRGMHGIEFIRTVRKQTSYDRTPIILLTGYDSDGIEQVFGISVAKLERDHNVRYHSKESFSHLGSVLLGLLKQPARGS